MAGKRDNRLKVLSAMPGSILEIKAATGLGLTTVWRWVNDLVASNEAHIHKLGVDPTGGPLFAIYHSGRKPNRLVVARPKLTTPMDRTNRYRKKLRQTGDWEDVKAKSRAAYWRKKKPQRDPLTAALFGTSS